MNWEVLAIWKEAWQAEWVITLQDFINCKQERALSSPCPCPGTVQNSNNFGFPLIPRSPTTLISPLISRVPRFPWPCSGSSLAFAWSHRSDARSQDKRHQTVTLPGVWSMIRPLMVWVFNPFFANWCFGQLFYKLSFQIFCCSRLREAVKMVFFRNIS